MSSGLDLNIDSMDNAAFSEDARGEAVRILREVADNIASGKDNGVVRDVNGNEVGSWGMVLPEADEQNERQRR